MPAAEALAWNESVKLAAMLFHWNLTTDYASLLRVMQTHQEWSGQPLFQQDEEMLEELLDNWPVEDTAPRIWACFHVGPYALISRALIKKGVGVAVLLKEEVYEEQHSAYIEGFRKSFDRHPSPADMQFIHAGSTGSLVQLKRCLSEGMHVVCFIDGEEGGASPNSKTNVQLHGMDIETRMGIASLSCWTGVPVRPLVLTVKHDKLNVRSPDDYTVNSSADYAGLMQYCYNTMMDLDPVELAQWQCIPALFEYFFSKKEDLYDNKQLKNALWMPVIIPDKYLLIDLRSGMGVELSKSEHQKIYSDLRELMEILAKDLSLAWTG